MKETERKFLVDQNKWKPKTEAKFIKQGYLTDDPKRSVRIRIYGEKAFLTIKGETKGITRDEFEYEIPVNDAKALMKMRVTEPIEKKRYKENVNGWEWEIDVFEGKNKGLVMAEIELDDESQKFDLPYWVRDEVTGDKRYFNLWLSKNPFVNWKS